MPRTEEQARLWTEQNEFVARILDDCRLLEAQAEQEEQRLQLTGTLEEQGPEDEMERQMRRIKQEREIQEAEEEIVAELRHAVTPATEPSHLAASDGIECSSSSESSIEGLQGSPFILVILDGTKAPFFRGAFSQGFVGGNDVAVRLRWETEKDLKDHPLHNEEGGGSRTSDLKPTVVAFVLVDPQVLLPRLQRQRLVSSADTFDAFIRGFQTFPEHNVVQTADGVVGTLADLLLNFGHASNLKRVYLGGVGYARMCNTTPELGLSNISINCSETPDEHDELRRSGWRIVDFKGLFDVDLANSPSFGGSQGSAALTTSGRQSSGTNALISTRAERYRSFTKPGSKHVFDPSKRILQQGDCVWHYVSPQGCKQSPCDRRHKYDLTSAGLQALREEVSTVRCKRFHRCEGERQEQDAVILRFTAAHSSLA
uniref:BY PROTMAP: gi/647401586/emb/CDR47928.1/ RHTO0S15e03818g2_1 [Rhodosporidium toruloides] n=1 Tax=Rhodotorula toruloides TaxID=5286 RepID=A0A0K3CEI7_RHOTO